MTNTHLLNNYINTIKERQLNFISNFKQNHPKFIYEQIGRQSKFIEIELKSIEYFDYDFEKILKLNYKKVPKWLIEKVYNDFYMQPEKEDNICINCTKEGRESTIRYKHIFTDYLQSKLEVDNFILKEKKKQEEIEILLSNGYKKCAYCGKLNSPETSIVFPISRRTRDNQGYVVNKTESYNFCPKECAGNMVFSMEG